MLPDSNLIVLLEPDEAVRSALCAMLQQHGWRIMAQPRGHGLAELLALNHPAAIICESSLPDTSAKSVLKTGVKAGIPVIFLGHAREVQDAVDLVQLGARDFLEKPFPQKRLLSILDKLSAR